MKTCTLCRTSGLTRKGYIPDKDEDIRLVTVEYPAPHQGKNHTTWMCLLHRKYFEDHGCRIVRPSPRKRNLPVTCPMCGKTSESIKRCITPGCKAKGCPACIPQEFCPACDQKLYDDLEGVLR